MIFHPPQVKPKIKNVMTEEKRFELLRELKIAIEEKGGNVMTLYCLVATMTDEKLQEFYNEYFKIN